MAKVLDLFVAFAKDRRGSIGVIFSLSLLPMFMMVGSAIDFGGAVRLKHSLQSAADAAVIAAAKSVVDNLPAGATSAQIQTALANANQTGQTVFQSNIPSNLKDASITIVTTSEVTATGSYSATAPVYFAKLMGLNGALISGTAEASYDLPYKSIFIFVDNTHSMSVGATAADRSKLASLTKPGCVFACHGVTSDNVAQGQIVSNTSIAESNGVKLRMDLVRDGVKRLIDSARTSALSGKIYIDFYKLDFGSINFVPGGNTTVLSLTNDYAALTAVVDQLADTASDSLSTINGRTPIEEFFSFYYGRAYSYRNNLGQKYALIITDGVRDRPRVAAGLPNSGYACSSDNQTCASALNPTLCEQFKAIGMTVAVIHMPYIASPGDDRYDETVGVIGSQVEPNLRSCASAGFYFQGSSSLTASINAFFGKLNVSAASTAAPRLTR